MTPDAQRIAIAEACGYKRAKDFVGWEDPRVWTKNGKHRYFAEQLPDYLTNLNAMHEAEERFNNSYDSDRHASILAEIVLGFPVLTGEITLNKWSLQRIARATAAQRAEAFLRTIGKWEDA